jgi:hypothetical protein
VFENKVLRRVRGPQFWKLKGYGENYVIKSFMILVVTNYYSGGRGMWQVYRVFVGKPERITLLGIPRRVLEIILKYILNK